MEDVLLLLTMLSHVTFSIFSAYNSTIFMQADITWKIISLFSVKDLLLKSFTWESILKAFFKYNNNTNIQAKSLHAIEVNEDKCHKKQLTILILYYTLSSKRGRRKPLSVEIFLDMSGRA